jgi:hypothetical protein
MATISKKLSPTDYEIIGDTQGVLVPQPVRFTRFKPSNILVDGSAGESHNYYVKPTPAQCAAGGGEDWNNGTNRFYFPKAGIYTISYPSYYIDNNSVQGLIREKRLSRQNRTGIRQKAHL